MTLPERSQVVVIGGGVVGCSIAYHLAERGVTDVVLVERKGLTNGSTWHAAGLVGQLRSSSNLTQLMRQSVQTYQTLEQRTGYPTGWHGVGSLRLASSADRWEELKRIATTGRSFGFEVELISAAEAGALFPLIDLTGVHGATWVPSDGYADPSQLTQSFATGARAAGVQIVQGCRVTGFERSGRRITAVRHRAGPDRVRHRRQRDRHVGSRDRPAGRRGRRRQRRRAPVRRDREARRHPGRPADAARPGRALLPQARERRAGHRRLGGRHAGAVAAHPRRPRRRALRARPRTVRAARSRLRANGSRCSPRSASRPGSTARSRSPPTPSR